MERINIVVGILYLVLVVIVYNAWFLPGVITGGDLWYFFPSMYDNHQIYPRLDLFFANNGFGGSSVPFMAINFVMSIPFLAGKTFGLSWEVLSRIFILFPFLIAVSLFPYLFFKKVFPDNLLVTLSSFIFTFNTYILMLVSGGLVVIGIAYSCIPVVFLCVLKILDFKKQNTKFNVNYVLLLGVVFGVQSVLDVRVTYMTLWGVFLFFVTGIFITREYVSFIKSFLFVFIIPLTIAAFLNAFWVIPGLLFGSNALGELGNNYTTVESVRFFSFAKFENSFSLLHPNWPENIFGKTYFQRPEFLILPILAFASLLFVNKDNKKIILPFVIIAIFVSFLAKGANDPFGSIYIFLFENIPGFVFFRDPTKWYMLIAFSYSVLIPFTLFELYKKFRKARLLIPLLFVLFFLITLIPAITGKLPGTLQASSVPNEYVQFERFMNNQQPGRILWIPNPSRFSYFSQKHPSVSSNMYFDKSKPSEIARTLDFQKLNTLVSEGVLYVALPYDNRGEIFLKDRSYDNTEYEKTLEILENNTNLVKFGEFGRLKLYSVNIKPTEPILSENKVLYRQSVVDLGAIISIISFFLVVFLLFHMRRKHEK